MIFKLAQSAAKGWRKLPGHQHIPHLRQGIRFIDGISEFQLEEQVASSPNTRKTQIGTVA